MSGSTASRICRSRTHEGSGIGLALVQELVKLHGGSIRAESHLGTGTTFSITVPLGSQHLPPDRLGGSRTLASTAVGAAPFVEEALRWLPEVTETQATTPTVSPHELIPIPCPPGQGEEVAGRPRVLIADDNADMRHYLARLLNERYNVQEVPDGQAALAAARKRRPDLVLSDVMMPNLDGFGLVRELRADAALKTIPIILLSARAGEESRVEGLQQGADDYLIKPFSARELLARVGAHLEMARMRQEAAEQIRQSEERFGVIVEGVQDYAIFLLDPEGNVVSWNAGAQRIKGYKAEEIVGRNFSIFYSPEDRDGGKAQSELATAVRDGRLEDEGWRVRKDGSRFWADIVITALRDEAGHLKGFTKIVRDITERKQAEEALREAHERAAWLARFPEENPDPVLRASAEGMVLYRNPAAAELPGWTCETGGPLAEPLSSLVRRAMTEGREVRQDVELGEAAYLVWAVPLPSEHYANIYGRDITDRKRAEEALRETRDYLDNLFNYANAPIIVWNPEFKITRFNPAFERLTGHEAKEVLGQEIGVLFPQDRREESLAHIRRTTAARQRWEVIEIGILQKNGSVRTVLWNSANVLAPDNQTVIATIAQGQDITERKRAEELLREANERLQAQTEELQTQAEELQVQTEELRTNEAALRDLNATLESKVAQRTAQLQQRARQLQKMTLEVSQAEDRERKRMAEILHDDLQQIIAGAKFHLGLLRNRVKYDASLQALALQIDQMLKDAIEKSRGLSHELSPAMLHHGDFTETLGWLAKQMQAKHGLVVHVHASGPVHLQSDAIKTLPVQDGPGVAVQRGQARAGEGGQNSGAAVRPLRLLVGLGSRSRL